MSRKSMEDGNVSLPVSSSTPAPLRKSTRMPELPRKDADIIAVAKKVAEQWAMNPQITLVWMDVNAFAAKVAAFNDVFGARRSAGSERPSQTQLLAAADETIAHGVSRVKVYIQEKWEDADTAYAQYVRYGLVKRAKNYELPRDRQQRLAALALMLAAISADGFAQKPCGAAFWETTRTQYKAALEDAEATDGAVSIGVSHKNLLKAELLKVMQALQLVLRGNYPETWQALLRQWGWQKEDY